MNYADASYSSATKALQALLDRTSFLVLEKLRGAGIENVTPVKPVSKSSGNGTFGDGPSTTHFPNSCAPDSHGSHGRQHPSLNVPVTVNLNGLTVSDTKAFSQGLFGSSQAISGSAFPRTEPKPREFFPGLPNEASSHANVAPASGVLKPSAQGHGGLFDPSTQSKGSMFGSSVQGESGMFGSSAQGNTKDKNDVFGSSAQDAASTTPFGRPLFDGQPQPSFSTLTGFTTGNLFGGSSLNTSTPGPFPSSTPPTLFEDSKVPRGSYRYNPTTGTAKASDRIVPDIAVTESSPKETADGETSRYKPFGESVNKKTRFFATVEDESPVLSNDETGENNFNNAKATESFTPLTTTKPAESAFSQFVLGESKIQHPPPPLRRSLFGQTPSSEEASTSTHFPPPAVSNFAQRVPLGAFPPTRAVSSFGSFLSAEPSTLTTPFSALNIQSSAIATPPGTLFDSPAAVTSTTPAEPPPPAAADSTPSVHSQNSIYMFDSPTPGARFAEHTMSAQEAERVNLKIPVAEKDMEEERPTAPLTMNMGLGLSGNMNFS